MKWIADLMVSLEYNLTGRGSKNSIESFKIETREDGSKYCLGGCIYFPSISREEFLLKYHDNTFKNIESAGTVKEIMDDLKKQQSELESSLTAINNIDTSKYSSAAEMVQDINKINKDNDSINKKLSTISNSLKYIIPMYNMYLDAISHNTKLASECNEKMKSLS